MDGNGTPQTPIVIFDEFLVAEEWRNLVDYTLNREFAFTQTQVIGGEGDGRVDHQYRRSRVLYELGPFQQIFTDRLMMFLSHALMRLNHPGFPVSHLEIQLTGTNNGEFFRVHSDNDAGHVSGRRLTFVYFFHREPLGFAGGELRIFDTFRPDGHAITNGVHRLVHPLQNQMVLFDSSCLHEILPVRCDSGAFADSRFTVNGWLHR